MRDGDDYVINGQKMWTSLIAYADYVWLAVRTNPEAKKHRGISMLIVPTTAEGFSWTPVHTMAGVDTSATYYQDVRVPATNLVGEENGGWKLVTNQLNHERVALVSAQPIFLALNGVREWAQNTKDVARQPADRLGMGAAQPRPRARQGRGAQADQLGAGLHRGRRSVARRRVGGQGVRHRTGHRGLPPADGGARHGGARCGTNSPGALLRGRVERMHRACLILTFGGGTNEIQRDIIGMVALGLPRVNR